jgi:hypothetical protein
VDDDEDVDGDGVTTGGVVLFVVDDVSRLQPAMPRTRPLTSSVTNAVFICDLQWLMKGCPTAGFSRIGAMKTRGPTRERRQNRIANQCCRRAATRRSRTGARRLRPRPTSDFHPREVIITRALRARRARIRIARRFMHMAFGARAGTLLARERCDPFVRRARCADERA